MAKKYQIKHTQVGPLKNGDVVTDAHLKAMDADVDFLLKNAAIEEVDKGTPITAGEIELGPENKPGGPFLDKKGKPRIAQEGEAETAAPVLPPPAHKEVSKATKVATGTKPVKTSHSSAELSAMSLEGLKKLADDLDLDTGRNPKRTALIEAIQEKELGDDDDDDDATDKKDDAIDPDDTDEDELLEP